MFNPQNRQTFRRGSGNDQPSTSCASTGAKEALGGDLGLSNVEAGRGRWGVANPVAKEPMKTKREFGSFTPLPAANVSLLKTHSGR